MPFEVAVSHKTFISHDPALLRHWWHTILSEHGRYSCYAFLLALPSDKEFLDYINYHSNELEILSGEQCLIITLSDIEIRMGGRYGVFLNESVINEVWTHVKSARFEDSSVWSNTLS
jgi:hypothetical protein